MREGDIFLVMRMSDFEPALRADLPAVLASLAHGDAAPFGHLFLRMSDLGGLNALRLGLQQDDDGYSVSRFLATACVEAQLPWSPSVGSLDPRRRRSPRTSSASARARSPRSSRRS